MLCYYQSRLIKLWLGKKKKVMKCTYQSDVGNHCTYIFVSIIPIIDTKIRNTAVQQDQIYLPLKYPRFLDQSSWEPSWLIWCPQIPRHRRAPRTQCYHAPAPEQLVNIRNVNYVYLKDALTQNEEKKNNKLLFFINRKVKLKFLDCA